MGHSVDQLRAEEIDRLKQEIEGLKKQLIQAQRLTALGELVSTTTHEFNNVLMTILNYARIGMRRDDKETRDRAFDKINQASQRAARITNSILCVARNRSEEFEATDLKTIVDHSMVLMEREFQKYHIAVELQIEEGVPAIWGVGNQIQQVVLNLMINARQAMLEGGSLIVGLRENPASRTVELSIRDFGVGISSDKLPKIFEPYFTTKSGPDATGKGGTGLGLFSCRSIMENHQGKIRVESTVGIGTCFTLIFPVRPVSPIPTAINAAQPWGAFSSGKPASA